jgi:hypothetical protein
MSAPANVYEPIVLPRIAFAIAVRGQYIMLLVSSVVLLGNDTSAGALRARLPLFRMSVGFLYTLTAIACWHARVRRNREAI